MEIYYQILLILLGWLLGILSPALIDTINNGYRRKSLKIAIITELKDTKIRLTMMSFLIRNQIGGFDKIYCDWLYKCIENYSGFENFDPLKKFLDTPELKDEKKINLILKYLNDNAKGKAISLKKINTELLDANFPNIHLFEILFQTKIFELKYSLNILDDEIQRAREYLIMTFDSSITNDNYNIIINEIQIMYKHIDEMAVNSVAKINKII
jgi:hypothetical protein